MQYRFFFIVACILFLCSTNAMAEQARLFGLTGVGLPGGIGSSGYFAGANKLIKVDLQTGLPSDVKIFDSASNFILTVLAKDPFRHILYLQDVSKRIISYDLETGERSDHGIAPVSFANLTVDPYSGRLFGLALDAPSIDFQNRGFMVTGSQFWWYDPTQMTYGSKAVGQSDLFNPTILGADLEKGLMYMLKNDQLIAVNMQTDSPAAGTWTYCSKYPVTNLTDIVTLNPITNQLFGLMLNLPYTGIWMGAPLGHQLSGSQFLKKNTQDFNKYFSPSGTQPYKAFGLARDPGTDIAYIQRLGLSQQIEILPFDTVTGGEGSAAAFLDSPLLTPVFDVPTIDYVALGDSYSAGTGAGDYFTSGQYSNDQTYCHRSANAYSAQLDLSDIFPQKRIRKWFYACHGAETVNIVNTRWDGLEVTGNRTEAPQAQRLGVKYADIISLTIGGNDLQFGPILRTLSFSSDPQGSFVPEEIFYRLSDLYSQYTESERKAFTLQNAVTNAINAIGNAKIGPMIDLIKSRSKPDARIFYLGYPHLFPPTDDPTQTSALESRLKLVGLSGISASEMQFANSMVDLLNSVISQISVAKGIYFVDVVQDFLGHEACSEAIGNEAYLTNYDLLDASKNQEITLFSESFHPNRIGHTVYANALREKIAQVGSLAVSNPPHDYFTNYYVRTQASNQEMAVYGELRVIKGENPNEVMTQTEKVTFSGSGFVPGTQIIIMYKDSKQSPLNILAETTADANGSLRYDVKMPPSTVRTQSITRYLVAAGMRTSSQAQLLVGTVIIPSVKKSSLPLIYLLLD